MDVWTKTYSRTRHSQQAPLSSGSRLTHDTSLSREAGGPWRSIRALTETQLLRRLGVLKLLEDSDLDSPPCRPPRSHPYLRGCPRGPEVLSLLDVRERRSLPGSQQDLASPGCRLVLLHLQDPETHRKPQVGPR